MKMLKMYIYIWISLLLLSAGYTAHAEPNSQRPPSVHKSTPEKPPKKGAKKVTMTVDKNGQRYFTIGGKTYPDGRPHHYTKQAIDNSFVPTGFSRMGTAIIRGQLWLFVKSQWSGKVYGYIIASNI